MVSQVPPSRMKFGLHTMIQASMAEPVPQRLGELLDQVRLARKLGFDSVFAGHHYCSSPYQMLHPMTLLARIASEVDGMNVGTGIFLLPLVHPIEAAEQTAALDVISGGRFIFGAGLGYRNVEFEAFNIPKSERAGRFIEALEIMKQLWTKSVVNFEGKFFKIRNASLSVKPIQRPHPPIWVAASDDKAVVRAAEIGDGWFVDPRLPFQTLEHQMTLYMETLKRLNKPIPREVPVWREVFVATHSDTALKVAQTYLKSKYSTYAQWSKDERVLAGKAFDEQFAHLIENTFIIGDPNKCIDKIQRYREKMGFNHFILRVQWPGMGHSEAIEAVRLFGERVLPYFKEENERSH